MSAEAASFDGVRFDAQGLVPVVAQEVGSGEVLLLAYMNAEALDATLRSGELTLWSRSRGRLWRKGETSGNRLWTQELRVNCEQNSLLARVRLDGVGACHEGYRSCFYRRVVGGGREGEALRAEVVEERLFDPARVYGAAEAGEQGQALGDGGDGGLAAVTRALYAGYERLRAVDLTGESGTSRLLRAEDVAGTARYALQRAAEELEELRGVVAGTHRHSGGAADVTLEAGQVEYWVFVAAIALGYGYEDWEPHGAWLAGWRGVDAAGSEAAGSEAAGQRPEALAGAWETLREAGSLCRAAGVAPAGVVEADLAALRAKYGQYGD